MRKLEQKLLNKKNRKKGLFISFEGLDGCGKTTQINLLMEKLKTAEETPILFREPGYTKVGEAIRKIVLHEDFDIGDRTELLLYLTSRAQVTDEVVIPSLEAGKILIADRYADSSVAYQGFGRGLGAETVDEMNNFAIKNVYPDMTIFLDIPPSEIVKRLGNKKLDRLEREKEAFFRRVHDGNIWLEKKHRNRFLKFDGLKPAEIIHDEIMTILKQKALFIAE